MMSPGKCPRRNGKRPPKYNNALNLGYPSLILQPGDPGTYGIAATARF